MSDRIIVTYNYYFLNQEEKKIYDIFFNGLKNKNTVINLSGVNLLDLNKIITALKLDHPELYYVNFNDTFNCSYSSLNISIKYFHDLEVNKINAIVNEIRTQVDALNNEYDKLVLIHNYIAKNCFGATPKYVNHDFDLYGALALNRAVCEGTSKAFMFLANQCGIWVTSIPCVLGKINHAINMARVNGEYMYLDVGNDLKRENLSFKHFGKICYPYFHHGIGLTLNMLRERQITLDKIYQIQPKNELNYLIRNKLIFHTLAELRLFFTKSVQKHKFLTIKYDGKYTHNKFIDAIRELLNIYFKDVNIIKLMNKTVCICGGDLYEG